MMGYILFYLRSFTINSDGVWYNFRQTCYEKESVLHTEQFQIINLTARSQFYKELSGCIQTPLIPTTIKPHYTLSVPTLPSRNRRITKKNLTENDFLPSTKSTRTTLPSYTTTTTTTQRTTASTHRTTKLEFDNSYDYSSTTKTTIYDGEQLELFNYTSTTERDLNLDFENLNDNIKRNRSTVSIQSFIFNSNKNGISNCVLGNEKIGYNKEIDIKSAEEYTENETRDL